MNVANRTAGKHLAFPTKDKDGRALVAVVVKYTYRSTPRGGVERDEDGAPPHPIDVPNGEDPATSSIKVPSDMFEYKPGTDVVVVADAHPRAGATYTDVALQVGPIAKTIRAHGLRVWQRGMLGGLVPGPALPLRAPLPIVYENAWGGQDVSIPDKPLGEPRNYAGRGITREPARLVDQPAAQLELAGKPLGERAGANVPASFGPIHRHWAPRASFAGTYDKAWQESRMPLLPADFDPRFNVCVPHDQWSEVPLFGDEPIALTGATEDHHWQVQLPRETLTFSSLVGGVRREHRTHLDTILIDARERKIELTWRAAVPAPPKLELLDEIRIEARAR
ncbi:MAG: DUF2169 domain-containing protein [Labilithrix sp.]|nr:DUF2169 domain-containing protein [Labilithrix sp.]MCW5811473.1 DUF2169 domain-containing protein [Labilithrix sp.]